MTYAKLQASEGTRVVGGSTISATYGSNVTAGSLLVAVVTRSTGINTSTVGQVTDNQGNYWKQAVELGTSTGYGVDIWYCESAGGGNKPQVTATQLLFANQSGTPTYNTGINMTLLEYSGASGYELVDQIGQSFITTTSVTATTWYNMASNHDLAISAVMGNMSAATVPSGWNSRTADTTQKFYVADNLDTGTSSGSTYSAAWTGLTGGSAGVAVIATFVQTGVAATAPRLVQTTYTDSAILQTGSGTPTWTSQAFPVNPTAGNALIAVMNGSMYNPQVICGSIIAVTDTAGNVWVPLVVSGPENATGINLQLWVCRNAKGGATTLTVTFSNNSQQLCCLLLELANFAGNWVVDRTAVIQAVNDPQTLSVTALAGDFAIAYRATIFANQTKGPASGWKQVISDTTGANCQVQFSTTAGTLTATPWAGTVGGGADYLLAALKSASGLGAH